MPFLVIGAVTAEIADSGEERHVEIGDGARSFDGTYRSTVRSSYKKEWIGVRTPPVTTTVADALVAELEHATQPRACSGDLTGSINCYPKNVRVAQVMNSGGFWEVVTFDLYQA